MSATKGASHHGEPLPLHRHREAKAIDRRLRRHERESSTARTVAIAAEWSGSARKTSDSLDPTKAPNATTVFNVAALRAGPRTATVDGSAARLDVGANPEQVENLIELAVGLAGGRRSL